MFFKVSRYAISGTTEMERFQHIIQEEDKMMQPNHNCLENDNRLEACLVLLILKDDTTRPYFTKKLKN